MKSPENKEKLYAWLNRPRGSFGWVAGVISFVLLLSVTTWFEPVVDPLMAHPWVVLLLAASSAAIGIVIQHRYTLLVGKSIFSAGATGWRKKVGLIYKFSRESNIVLGIILLFGLGYPAILYFAARSTETIVSACKNNLDTQLSAGGEGDEFPSISLPLCQCLSKVFLDKNGVLRLALFNTTLLDVTDFQGVTEADEERCMETVIKTAPDLALRHDIPMKLPEARPFDQFTD